MYQVYDWELFGLPPPLPPLQPLGPLAEDDNLHTLRRYHDPGDCIDDALGFLGLGFEWQAGGGGCKMGVNGGEDPEGGWDWLEAAAEMGGELGGQLMGIDDDYVNCSCFSSGLTSPSLDSDSFFRPTQTNPLEVSCSAATVADNDLASLGRHHHHHHHHPPEFQWNFPPGIRCNFSSRRPDSPCFHLDSSSSSTALPGCAYRGCHGQLRGEFEDSETEESVRAIARYLASFEVQTPDSYPDYQKVNGSSPLQETASTGRPNGDPLKSTVVVMPGGSVGLLDHGHENGGRGFESASVNPSDVFPERVDRFFDHQYASLARRGPRGPCPVPPPPPPPPPSIRRSPPPPPRAVSVLEALLRSTEPIDPNRGSGAAVVALEAADEEEPAGAGCRGNADAIHKKASSAAAQVMMLKRLLMG